MRSNMAKARKRFGLSNKVKFVKRHDLLRRFEGSFITKPIYMGEDKQLLSFIEYHLWDEKTYGSKFAKSGAKLTKAITHPSLKEARLGIFQEVVRNDGYYIVNIETGMEINPQPRPFSPIWYEILENNSTVHEKYMYPVRAYIGDKELVLRTSKFIEQLQPQKLIFSCRANDIMRMSNSKHFSSCMRFLDLKQCKIGKFHGEDIDIEDGNGINAEQLYGELVNPDVGVLFSSDKGGDMLGRCLVRLMKDKDNNFVIGLQRMYGNLVEHQAVSYFKQFGIPVYDLYHSNRSEALFSPTVYYAPKLVYPQYNDCTVSRISKSGKLFGGLYDDADTKSVGKGRRYRIHGRLLS